MLPSLEKRVFAGVMKDFEMRRSPLIIQAAPKSSVLIKSWTEADLTRKTRQSDQGGRKWVLWLHVKERSQPLEAGEARVLP